MSNLNHDILLYIASFLEADQDYGSLFCCSLVDRAMNNAMNQVLYRKIILSPVYSNVFRLGRHNQELNQSWKSALLPHNADWVLELQVLGFLVEKAASQNNFSAVLCSSIQRWKNLQSVTLMPRQYHAGVFTDALSTLKNSPRLRRLAVNRSCFDEPGTTLLTNLEDLTSLTLEAPTRIILQELPQWLSRLQPNLRELHLTDNCGSITPGILKACAPHLSELSSFTLGLSYTITDDDAFEFFNQLKALSSLDFRYYLQLRVFSVRPKLPMLRSLIVRHDYLNTQGDATYLTRWIRWLSSRSPLQEFTLAIDRRVWLRPPTISLDSLVDHLGLRHGQTLIILDIRDGYIGQRALTELCTRCQDLQMLFIGTTVNVLEHLYDILSLCPNLHTAAIFTPNIKANKVQLETAVVKNLMARSPKLRRFALNQTHWEALWTSDGREEVVFTVRQLQPELTHATTVES